MKKTEWKYSRKRRYELGFFTCIFMIFALTGCAKYNQQTSDVQVTNQKSSNLIQQEVASETEQVLVQETEEIPETLSLLMVGDVLLHDPLLEGAKGEDGTYDFGHFFTHTKEEIQASDLAIVNMEVILGGEELRISGYPAFNAPYEIGDALAEAGFDVILQGSNHALDRGIDGIHNCLRFWREKYPDVQVLGIYDSKEARDTILLYEKNGMTIALLNYTYGTNGISLPSNMPYCVSLIDEVTMKTEIEKAEKLADFTIVMPHWGTEYRLEATDSQRALCEMMAEEGVDLVIGTHPHVIEPVEWYESESGHRMLVYYSLGNYINATSGTGKGTANRMLGAMAKVELKKNPKGVVEIISYDALPLAAHLKEDGKAETYYLETYHKELALLNLIRRQDQEFTFEYLVNTWNQVLGTVHPVDISTLNQ